MTIGDSQHVRQFRPAQAVRRWALLTLAVAAAFIPPRMAAGQTPIIDTWAGGGPPNGAVAASVSIGSPNSVATDGSGTYFIASSETRLVYRVDGAGLVHVFAGGGTRQDGAADGHPGLEAALNRPSHVVWFGDGLFVVETQRIRRIDTVTGIVSTVTGGGTLPFTDGMTAADAGPACPSGLAISPAGEVFFTDLCDNTIKRIDTAGILTRVAGVPADPGGFGGDGGPASLALFRRPKELALDPDTGDLAIIDQANRAETGIVRRISAGSDGVVTGAADEIISSLTAGGCCEIGPINDGQPALLADMRGLTAVTFDDGSIVVAQTYEGPAFLWRIRSNGLLRLIGGVDSMTRPRAPGLGDGDGRLAVDARFGAIAGMMQTSNLDILVADQGLHAVRLINDLGEVYRIAGNASVSLSGDGGPATAAQLFRPSVIAFNAAGTAVVVDQDRSRLRVVDAATGAISSLSPVMPDGSAFRAQAMALHPLTGHVYFANGDERIHALNPATGVVTVAAGTGRRTCSIDCEGGDPRDDLGDFGPAVNATFNSPVSMVFDTAGNLYLADLGNHRVRRIDAATGIVRTVAGIDIAGSGGYGGDGGTPVNAQLRNPWAVALGPDGTLFIADTGNNRIRAVTPQANGSPSIGSGTISTVVNGYDPRALAVDATGRLFFGGSGYADVRVWDGANVSVYVNTQGIPGFSGDGGPAIDGRISTARGLAIAGGALFIADDTNHRIRVVRAGGGRPDLVILKATTSTFQQGGTATYDLGVTNGGTAPTTGLYTITDVLPAGLTATGASGTGWDCSASTTTTITCTTSTVLAPGQAAPVVTIGVDVGATAPASITNTAGVAGGGDADTTNNSSSVTSTVTQLVPDLTIAKSTTSAFQQGGTATYDLVVSNSGNGPATGTITLSDQLPAGLTLAGLPSAAGWDCAASTAQAVSCTSTTALPAGQAAATVSFTVDISATAAASLTNTATVSGGGETDTTNNSSSVTSVVTQLVPDLIVTKTTPSSFEQRGTATYDLVVSNIGTGATRSPFTITDPLPAGLTLAGAASGAGWNCAASTSTVVSCIQSATLPAGQAAPMITFTVDIAANAPALVTNTASVAGGGETDTTNNTSSVTRSVLQLAPDLTISKTTTSVFAQGGTATYEFVVRNGGNGSTFADYTVTDVLPVGLTLAGTAPVAGWDCTASTSTVVRCTRSTALAAGQAAPAFTISVDIALTAPAAVTNTATVSGGGDTNTANDTASVTSAVAPAVPDLTIVKSTTSTFQAGGTAAYVLAVRNVGNGTTSGAYTIVDPLPAGLTFASAAPAAGWDCAASTPSVVSCTSSAAVSGGQAAPAVTITVNIAANAPATLINTATVAGGGETNTGNNASTVTNTLAGSGPPDLALTMETTTSMFVAGGTATYSLTVRNVGTGPTRAAYTLGDLLPSGLQLIQPPSGVGWTCNVSGRLVTCSNTTVLPPGGTAPIVSLQVVFDSRSTESITNRAWVSDGGEPFPGRNNEASITTRIGLPDLALAIAATGTFTQGGQATHNFTVTNVGEASAGNARVTMTLVGVGQPYSLVVGSGWTCSQAGALTCSRTTQIAPGESSLVATVTANIPAFTSVVVAFGTVLVSGPETNWSNNSASVRTAVTRALPDLAIDAALSGVLQPGGTAVYTVTVTNVGNAPTPTGPAGVYLVSPLPPFRELVLTAFSAPGWTCGSLPITCRRSTPLAPGESAPAITVTARVSAPAGTSVVYSPRVALPGDPNLSNNTATITSNVVP